MNSQPSTKDLQPFSSPQAEVDALVLFAAEHPNWRRAASNMAAELQAAIFAGYQQLTFKLKMT